MIELQAIGFGDPAPRLKARLPKYSRTVYAACGEVARSVPLVVVYQGRGMRRRAHKLKERLSRAGYTRVRIERARRPREAANTPPLSERNHHAETRRAG